MLVNVNVQVEVSREYADRCMAQSGAGSPQRAVEAVLERQLLAFVAESEGEPSRPPPPPRRRGNRRRDT